MPRVDPDALEHHDLEQIFIAAKLAEAQRVEEVLTLEGIQYVVNVEQFVSGFLSFRPRNGAVFYVALTLPPETEPARALEFGRRSRR